MSTEGNRGGLGGGIGEDFASLWRIDDSSLKLEGLKRLDRFIFSLSILLVQLGRHRLGPGSVNSPAWIGLREGVLCRGSVFHHCSEFACFLCLHCSIGLPTHLSH